MTETPNTRPTRDVFFSSVPVEVHDQFKAQARVFELTAAEYLEKLTRLDKVAAKAVRLMAEARDRALA